MSKEKQARREMAGPQFNPMAQQISYGMSPIPGAPTGPGNMNGNPENVTSLGQQASTLNPVGEENLYRDANGLQYFQTGTDSLNPFQIPRSQVRQNTPLGQKNNAGAPYNLQMGPPPEMADNMAGANYATQAEMRGLQANEFMGPIGLPAEAAAQGMQQDPAAVPGQMSSAGAFMPTVNEMQAMNSMNPMTPGASPIKKGKKRGKK